MIDLMNLPHGPKQGLVHFVVRASLRGFCNGFTTTPGFRGDSAAPGFVWRAWTGLAEGLSHVRRRILRAMIPAELPRQTPALAR